jgi:uncharacterized protein (TIGR02145 family)
MKIKRIITLTALAFAFSSSVFSQVGIGTTTPNPSAELDVTSTTKGLLPPRMTQAQRNAILSPVAGLMVWCTDCVAAGELQVFNGTTWTNLFGGITGTISTISCGTATNSGTLTPGTAASGVTSAVPYTGGNGGTHSGQTVNSTGVTGLTATLSAGTFLSGSGSVIYTITGTPASSGTATFALNIGGKACDLTRTVVFVCSPLSVTFTYNGASVTYGVVANTVTNKCWLDRNLGATQVAQSSTDHLAYGDIFQWGRGADGHQRITWTNATSGTQVNGTTGALSTTDSPGHALFITTGSGFVDWRSGQNVNLWQGVSGTNNPCPSGYRLPTSTEINAERTNWTGGNNAAGAFASPLKLPMSGVRDDASGFPGENGTVGYYWTSTVNGITSNYLRFDSSNAWMTNYYRARGGSVRCVKD